jgi:putative ABC transport system substrate-binding protein
VSRREFITLLGGAALSGALPAGAQKRTALIGLLGSGSAQSSGVFVDSLKEGLSDNSLREGRDDGLDLRWAEGNYERFPAFARELVERNADVILVTTIAAVRAGGHVGDSDRHDIDHQRCRRRSGRKSGTPRR